MDELREACETVAARARSVRIDAAAIRPYAASLAAPLTAATAGPIAPPPAGLDPEGIATFWLTLDSINFGSGWFPTLRKRDGRSGYNTVALAWREHHGAHGPLTPAQLAGLDATAVATMLGQDPGHELMALYALSLNDLGARLRDAGGVTAVIEAADGSAITFARRLGTWDCFTDVSRYDRVEVPFLKRAQIAAADLHRAGSARFADLDWLTMFADNLVPHVLRLDGVLVLDPGLVARIESGQLIEHDSREEIELRACALHAVELIVAALQRIGASSTAAEVDQLLWTRGQGPRYKAVPRHRSRCTAY
ncbi:MAG: queuosine salvage family protein [Solirubrobacteraceae bacterium]